MEKVGTAEMPREVLVKRVRLSPASMINVAEMHAPFEPIATDERGQMQFISHGSVQVSIEPPTQNGEQCSYLFQFAWKASDEEAVASIQSRPFVVKVARTGDHLTCTTDGISNLSDPSAVASGAIVFTLEAPVTRIFEASGGREVLMQLQGEPYWKRFSMEKKDWLPLPPVSLSTVDLAANLSSLFVLDRNAGELRKYNLSDLAPTGSVKLEAATQFYSVRAGCNSDRAPIHVVSSRGIISFDSESLRLKVSSTPNLRSVARNIAYQATGDGLSVASMDSSNSYSTFGGDYIGMKRNYFGIDGWDVGDTSVSGAFRFSDGALQSCANTDGAWVKMPAPPPVQKSKRHFIFPNSPVIARFTFGEIIDGPPLPPQLQFYGFMDPDPIGEMEMPELSEIMSRSGEDKQTKHRVCVDPMSRRLGILKPDQKTWVIREVSFDAHPKKPALLNWPETTVVRGGEFRFSPVFLGEARLSAELLGAKEPVTIQASDREVSFRVAEGELAALLLLQLKLTGPQGANTYSIPIYVDGPPVPFVWPDLNPGFEPDEFAAGFKSLTLSKEGRIGLKTSFYESWKAVRVVLGPIAGHLALVTDGNQVDFISLETKKLVGPAVRIK
jgi:hypothetical protein